jgi:hypothetical protein
MKALPATGAKAARVTTASRTQTIHFNRRWLRVAFIAWQKDSGPVFPEKRKVRSEPQIAKDGDAAATGWPSPGTASSYG